MVKKILCLIALTLCPAIVSAQGTTGVNPVYRRAQTMVNDGNAATGRALVDSMIAVAAPGSNEYAEGVYWRAVLAATAADAEMDYRRIVVDFPASSRVEDALIRLAQLEIARANYDGALRHLNRLVMEHPESPARARAGYWTARALFDKNDVQGGCAATADALMRTSEGDAELRNQITYLDQRCAGVVLTSPGQPTAPTVPVTTASTSAPAVDVAPRDSTSVTTLTTPPRDTVSRRPVAVAPAPVIATSPAVPPRTKAPSTIVPSETAEMVAASTGGGDARRAWSVQVAAYNVKSQADAMVARLKKNGYEARVDGSAAPFRVKIGRYATQGQANAVQRSLKAKQIEGFVVQADTR